MNWAEVIVSLLLGALLSVGLDAAEAPKHVRRLFQAAAPRTAGALRTAESVVGLAMVGIVFGAIVVALVVGVNVGHAWIQGVDPGYYEGAPDWTPLAVVAIVAAVLMAANEDLIDEPGFWWCSVLSMSTALVLYDVAMERL